MKFLFSLPIHFYRLFISPFLGTNCRFAPSCSAYALEAIKVHGPIKGFYLGIRRIIRCNPWGGAGYDPVPMLSTARPDEMATLSCKPSSDGRNS